MDVSRNVIEVEGVSKCYLLGEERPGRSLRDALSTAFRRSVGLAGSGAREQFWALRDVNLSVAEGGTIGLIGRNGAGKSTLLKILARITEPTRGVARMRGRVAALLEVGTGFHPELTGRENVYLNGAILGMSRHEIRRRFDEIVTFAGLEMFVDTPVKRYSSGMYLRLAFAVAAHLEPDILVVDEVLAVGDAEFQTKCIRRMETAEQEGRTVVFVSHNLGAITKLCPRIIWLDRGSIQADGPGVDVVDAYLSAQSTHQPGHTVAESAEGSVVLRSVSILNEAGRTVEVLQRDQPFRIELQFVTRTPTPGLDVSAWVFDVQGREIINEAWSDTAMQRTSRAGEYIATLSVPPVLNVGEYAVGVWIGTFYETLLEVSTAGRFRLEGDVRYRPRRAVVLDLPWQVRRTGEFPDSIRITSDLVGR